MESPLEKAEKLSEKLGNNILLKREDLQVGGGVYNGATIREKRFEWRGCELGTTILLKREDLQVGGRWLLCQGRWVGE